MRPLLYLAAPYTHPDALIRQGRLKTFCHFAARLESAGEYHVVSGLYNCLLTGQDAQLPDDYSFWQSYSRTMLSHARFCLVLTMPGWRQSIGVTDEIAFAHQLGIPVAYLDPLHRSLNTEPPAI